MLLTKSNDYNAPEDRPAWDLQGLTIQVNGLKLLESAHEHIPAPPIPTGSPQQASMACFRWPLASFSSSRIYRISKKFHVQIISISLGQKGGVTLLSIRYVCHWIWSFLYPVAFYLKNPLSPKMKGHNWGYMWQGWRKYSRVSEA